MSIKNTQVVERDTLNRAFVSKSATGTQIMAGSLRLLGGLTIDGVTTLGAITTGAISAGASAITTTGRITAGTFAGSGASLTGVPATALTGTVADARLSTNVVLLSKAQTFTANNTYSSSASVYYAGGTTYYVNGSGSAKFNTLNVTGALTVDGNDYLTFGSVGTGAPANSSTGTKIRLYGTSYQIGVNSSELWYDSHTKHNFYTNSGGTVRTLQAEIRAGGLNVYGDVSVDKNLQVAGEFKAGGVNEFPDPLLASKSTYAWSTLNNGTMTYEEVQAPGEGIGASGSLKIVASAADAHTYSKDFLEVAEGEDITFSAYGFSTTSGKPAQIYIAWYNAASSMLSTTVTNFTMGTAWARYSVTGKAPATATKFRVRIDNDGGAGTIMYYSAFQVERSTTLTPLKPYLQGIGTYGKKLKIPANGEIESAHNDSYIIKDHANGNITLSAAGAYLYLGYTNTTRVVLYSHLYGGNGTTLIASSTGVLYYQGGDTDSRYLKLTDGGTLRSDVLIEKSNPWLSLSSSNSGANGVEQAAGITIGESGYKGSAALHLTYTGDGYGYIGMGSVSSTTSIPSNVAMKLYYTNDTVQFYSTPNVAGNPIWHTGNDGAGSGLDADVLDGMQPTNANTARTIVHRDASGNFSAGTITASLNGTATNISNSGTVTLATATEQNSITITAPTLAIGKPVKLLNFNWYADSWAIGNVRSSTIASAGLGIFLNSVEKYSFTNTDFLVGSNKFWHEGNDGSGSTLDADLLDGVHKTALMSSTVYRQKYVVPVGGVALGVAIPIGRSYVVGTNRLQVFRDGILQELADDYTEFSTTSVKFTYNLPEGTRVSFVINQAG